MRGCDLRGHLTGLDQIGNHVGPLLAEQVRRGQTAVSTDHHQRVDLAFQRVTNTLAPPLLGAELAALRGAEARAAAMQYPPDIC